MVLIPGLALCPILAQVNSVRARETGVTSWLAGDIYLCAD